MSIHVKKLDDQRPGEALLFPEPPLTSYVVAGKGGGKTTLILNLLMNNHFLKNKFNKILWISPTAKFDSKVNIIKHENILLKNTDLERAMKKYLNQNKKIMDDYEGSYNEYVNLKNKGLRMDDNDFIEELSLEDLDDIMYEQKQVMEQFGKKCADKILLILDDSIENKMLKTKAFKSFIFQSRHYNISLIFISQSYFSLPKPLRLNSTNMIIFDTGNKKELYEIFSENNNGLDWQDFLDMFNDIHKKPYSFLQINYGNERKYRFIDCLDNFIVFE